MGLKLVTAPSVEPVTTAEAEAYVGVAASGPTDALIAELILASRRACEAYTRRAFISQTWDLVLDDVDYDVQSGRMISDLRRAKGWIKDPLVMPLGQLSTSGLVVYVTDDLGVETAADVALYYTDIISDPGRIIMKLGQTWPNHRNIAGVRIRFTAGWANAAAVPEDIKIAIKRTVRVHYGKRDDLVSESLGDASMTYAQGAEGLQIPAQAMSLLNPWRIFGSW